MNLHDNDGLFLLQGLDDDGFDVCWFLDCRPQQKSFCIIRRLCGREENLDSTVDFEASK